MTFSRYLQSGYGVLTLLLIKEKLKHADGVICQSGFVKKPEHAPVCCLFHLLASFAPSSGLNRNISFPPKSCSHHHSFGDAKVLFCAARGWRPATVWRSQSAPAGPGRRNECRCYVTLRRPDPASDAAICRTVYELAFNQCYAQAGNFGEIVKGDGIRTEALPPPVTRLRLSPFFRRFNQRFNLLHVDAIVEFFLKGVDLVTEQRLFDGIPVQFAVQKLLQRVQKASAVPVSDTSSARGTGWMPIEQMACRSASRPSCYSHHPRRLLVNITVSDVGQRHNLTDSFYQIPPVFPCASPITAAASVKVLYNCGSAASTPSKRLLIKPALREAVLTTLLTISALTRWTKSSGVQVDVINAKKASRCSVVAQAAGVSTSAAFTKGAARLRHLRAVHRHVTVNEQVGRITEVAAFQSSGRPEQAVK